MTAAPQTQQQPRTSAPPATGPARELWNQAKAEYEQALAIATQIWTVNHPPEALNAVTATLLIHFDRLRYAAEKRGKAEAEQERRRQQQAAAPVSGPAPVAPQTDGPVPDCDQCGGEMYDNRRDKKTPRSPDFRCKDVDCGHAVWLTPPPRGQRSAGRNQGGGNRR